MKTPEEIKRGLELCITDECEKCAYSGWTCVDDVHKEALTYITGLEAMLDATITNCRAEVLRLEKALEAAREDMREMAHEVDGPACRWCGVKLLEECGKCTTCNEGFRWRGTSEYKPRKENGNVY